LHPKEPAPPYAEIKQSIEHIMSKWDVINEPGTPDFKFDPEVMKELHSYNDAIHEKVAIGWRGWLVVFYQEDFAWPGSDYYDLTVSMVEPSTRTDPTFGDRIRIREIRRDVLASLIQCEDFQSNLTNCSGPDASGFWARVIFTGTITWVDLGADVELKDAIIAQDE
jgi:hypothetical protein